MQQLSQLELAAMLSLLTAIVQLATAWLEFAKEHAQEGRTKRRKKK